MNVLRYEDSLADITSAEGPTIFLAGPTVRGNQPHLTSWRGSAVREFQDQGFEGTLILPEFTSRRESDKGKAWIPKWEFAGLSGCDVIMFWIPRTRELIGLTTNHEHGYWLSKARQKMVYGRPDDSYRNGYLDLMWELDARQNGLAPPPVSTMLSATVTRAREQAVEFKGRFRQKSMIQVDSPYGEF